MRSGPVTLDDYNTFCASLPGTSRVVQWGGAEVWKVGTKVFAIGREAEHGEMAVSFKCSEMAFRLLADEPGFRPAPYMASRGPTWIQRHGAGGMDDGAFKEYLAESHRLMALQLSNAARREIGLPEKPRGDGRSDRPRGS